MSWYPKLKAAADPIVEYWRTDFEHDRQHVEGYTGALIYAARVTGTNQILLDGTPLTRLQREAAETFTFANDRYWIGRKNGVLEPVSRDRALEEWRWYLGGLSNG